MDTLDNIDKAVLRKLLSRRVIKSHHIRLTTLLKCGWKAHERGRVRISVDKLIKMGLIVWIKKSKQAFALNKGRLASVLDLVR